MRFVQKIESSSLKRNSKKSGQQKNENGEEIFL